MTAPDHLAAIRADLDRLVAVAGGDLDAAVPSCPGWDVRQLLRHTGYVHRWVASTVRTRATERVDFRTLGPAPDDDAGFAPWVAEGGAALIAELTAADPDDHAWNWSTQPHRVHFWPRRMAQETSIHRWDGEGALGTPAPIDAALAVDGIEEIFDTWVPAGIRDKEPAAAALGGSLHVHCTDAEGEWVIAVAGGEVDLRHEHAKGDAAARGTASDLNLVLWGRLPLDAVDIHGDPSIIDRLRTLASR